MKKQIVIDPITRLEGHGKITIFLDDNGQVEHTCLQVPDFRGFEKFCEGRAVEEMPVLTQKICGVCPTAHHIASIKALDNLFQVVPPPAGRKLRELMHTAFIFEDHLLHFYFLGGPDFIAGPDAPRDKRNIFGVIEKAGIETAKRVLDIRKRVRGLHAMISGSPLYPVCGLPGGVSRAISEEDRSAMKVIAEDAVGFARFTLQLFKDIVLGNREYLDLINNDAYFHQTYYMGLVDEANKVNFYDGKIRITDPGGAEFARFEASEYLDYLQERVEPWTYLKTLYLKGLGWKGFHDGIDNGVYRVGPLARLNASAGMATPLAQMEYDNFFNFFGTRPVHNTLAYHWARLIETLYAAERMKELTADPELTKSSIRNIPETTVNEGIGVCEAPRGTLLHHYTADNQCLVMQVNLLVATQNNAAALSLSVDKAARAFLKPGDVSEKTLNMVEMAFRAYDPCLACATHVLFTHKGHNIA
jgi:F420-non-reducing hydrogenase large subunit